LVGIQQTNYHWIDLEEFYPLIIVLSLGDLPFARFFGCSAWCPRNRVVLKFTLSLLSRGLGPCLNLKPFGKDRAVSALSPVERTPQEKRSCQELWTFQPGVFSQE
jgi:hypothetical protein